MTVFTAKTISFDRAEDMKAQEERSRRYRIQIREDGSLTKPTDWADLADSQWGDPVNYFFPVADREYAERAKVEFIASLEEYDEESKRVIVSRINRLARKYSVEPIRNTANELKFDTGTDETHNVRASITGEVIVTDSVSGESGPQMQIAAARRAVLYHPWFGKMILDDDFFESMIDNWETNLLGVDVAIDAEHRNGPTGGMALAWVNGARMERDRFMLSVKPTQTGAPLLGNEYRYTSIEFYTNYFEREIMAYYGPALVACAATNLPFVHRNDPIQPRFQVSQSDVGLPVASVIVSGWEPIVTTGNAASVTISNDSQLTASEEDNQVEEGETAQVEGETAHEGVQEMSDKNTEVTTPEIVHAETLVVGDREFSADDVTALLEQQAELERQRAEDAKALLQAEVDAVRAAANDRGVPPVAIRYACSLMAALGREQNAAITMEDGSQKEMTTFEALKALLGAIPGKAGEVTPPVEEGERPDDTHDGDENMNLEQAEEEAKKRRKELKIGKLGDQQVSL